MTNDPFREMYEQMNQMFKDITGDQFNQINSALPIDVQQTDDKVIVRADMPGVEKDNIRLKLRDNTLHLAAESETEVHEEGKDYLMRERNTKSYSRSVRFPVPVDETSASANYEDGVLTVEINRADQTSGTDIDIE